jgi:molybdopterin-guanine dinucleotide biosynthesis protein A
MTEDGALLQRSGGLVLAGGASRRFGSEKAAAVFAGRAMIARAVDKLTPCARIAISARAESEAGRFAEAHGFSLVMDNPAHPAGPLAGIAAGLKWAETQELEALATIPCDVPLAPAELIVRLAAQIGQAPAAFAASGQDDHPLCALWRAELLAPLEAQLARGVHPPVRAFLIEHGARRVRFEEGVAFANANTPAELSKLEQTA